VNAPSVAGHVSSISRDRSRRSAQAARSSAFGQHPQNATMTALEGDALDPQLGHLLFRGIAPVQVRHHPGRLMLGRVPQSGESDTNPTKW
jgi:hypothetical protein